MVELTQEEIQSIVSSQFEITDTEISLTKMKFRFGNINFKEKQCDEMYLEVRCSNTDAVKLYEQLGMFVKQRLKSYYRDGEDAYMMAIEF